jgi:hypothetical protein
MVNETLGTKTCNRVEYRLRQRFGLSLAESISEFHYLDTILRELFGAGADGIEQGFLERIMSMANFKKREGNARWINVEHSNLIRSILTTYGDDDKRRILDTVIRKPLTVPQILSVCKIPKTSGYRMIGEMLDSGLLYEEGSTKTTDDKRIPTYGALFERVKINIESERKTGTSVQILVKEDIVAGSQINRLLGIRDSIHEND